MLLEKKGVWGHRGEYLANFKNLEESIYSYWLLENC